MECTYYGRFMRIRPSFSQMLLPNHLPRRRTSYAHDEEAITRRTLNSRTDAPGRAPNAIEWSLEREVRSGIGPAFGHEAYAAHVLRVGAVAGLTEPEMAALSKADVAVSVVGYT